MTPNLIDRIRAELAAEHSDCNVIVRQAGIAHLPGIGLEYQDAAGVWHRYAVILKDHQAIGTGDDERVEGVKNRFRLWKREEQKALYG